MRRRQNWLDSAAYLTWLICGVAPFAEIVAGRFVGERAVIFVTSFVVFGAALWLTPRASSPFRCATLLGLQSVAGLVMVAASGNGTQGATLVIVAAQLPYVVPSYTWIWVAAQSVVNLAIFWTLGGWINGLVAGVALGAFQLFGAATSFLALRERHLREELTTANAELHATRALLAENARAAERIRIARDLHDALGHHLTALSLQLEVASRVDDADRVATHVREAHAIAKLLLSDVRSVVSEMRDANAPDLAAAVRGLVQSMQGDVAIHLDMPDTLPVDDGAQAHVVLRAVQEIITNALRHASAANLWIRIVAAAEGVTLDARDDGQGAAGVRWGNGLQGIRERFEAQAGKVDVHTVPGGGFEIHAVMPLRASP